MIAREELPPIGDFEGWARHFRSLYHAAKRRKQFRPRDNAINALKDALYAYFCQLKSADLMDELKRHILETHEPWKGPLPGEAAWVVRLIETGNTFLLDDSARNRMVADLMLAEAHNIAPEMLLAFLFEAGPIGLRKKALASEEPLPWADRYRAHES